MAVSDVSERRSRLEGTLQSLGITPTWMRSRPDQIEAPRIDRWSTLYPLLLESGEVVTLGDDDAFRRAFGGYQIVMPGETAAAHRHTASAMRFVVKGDGLGYTTSNGEQMFMEPGDLLVQPSFTWHDHGNQGQEPVIWFDNLDIPLMGPMEAQFHEDWPDGRQQPVRHPEGYHSLLYGQVRPGRLIGAPLTSIQDSPPVIYKFKNTMKMFELMEAEEENDPHLGLLLEFANPITGAHTLPTMSARIQMLRPGEATRPIRHTGFIRYNVVRGQGVTSVDLENSIELDWDERDIVRIPSWRWYRHRNLSTTEPAILFSISYFPLAESLGIYREERG